MQTDYIIATFYNVAINLLNTIIALTIGIIAFKIIDKKVMRNLDMEEELKNNNIAVAIFSATILIFVALSVTLGLKG